jgi:hypothetical protein
MQLGTEDKKISVHRLVIVFLIAFIVLVIALVILHLNEQQKVTDEVNQIQKPSTEDNKTPNAPGTLSEAQIEQIKMDIITGKRDDVPAEVGLTKDDIINAYLYTCSIKDDVNVRISCSEIYYLSDESLKQQKKGCEKLDGLEKTKCLDNYYFKIATTLQADYCEAITNISLKEECVGKAN